MAIAVLRFPPRISLISVRGYAQKFLRTHRWPLGLVVHNWVIIVGRKTQCRINFFSLIISLDRSINQLIDCGFCPVTVHWPFRKDIQCRLYQMQLFFLSKKMIKIKKIFLKNFFPTLSFLKKNFVSKT